MRRLGVRLKSFSHYFRDRGGSEIARSSLMGLYAGGNAETHRSFGTSNVTNLDLEGCWLRELSLQEKIVSALCLEERNKASTLLSELGSASQELQAEDFIYILQYCARKPDPLFVMETWKLMEYKGIEFSGKCYSLTIRALCKAGYLNEAFNILSFQRENSEIYPTLPIYNNLLSACIQMHNFNLTSKCLHLMEEQGVGKNLITYWHLLKLAVWQQDLYSVQKIWKECVNLQSLSIITLHKFVWSFAKLRDLESACVALQQMVALAFQHKYNITKTAERKICDSRLDIPIPSRTDLSLNIDGKNHGMLAPQDGADGCCSSQQPLPPPVMKLLRQAFSNIIQACANSQNVRLAKQLMSQMQKLGLQPTGVIYDGFVKSLVSVKDFREGIEVLKTMRQKNKQPYNSTLAVLSVCCSQALELDLAENFLYQMSSCRHAYTFNAFLQACDILDQPERAARALARMKILKVLPDIRTYELMFSLFGNVNSPYDDGHVLSQAVVAKRINIIEADMKNHGIQHSTLSMMNLLKALGREGMTKEMIWHLNVAEKQFSHGSTPLSIHTYDTVLHSLVKAKESSLAGQIFKSIISSGLPPTAATYAIMINCCRIMECYNSARALVSMMIRHGFFPNLLTYTALIKILLKFDDFDEAFRLLDQACSEGIQPDHVLYNAVLELASEKGRLDVIELIVSQMHRMKIQPDPSTCSHVFSAYIDHGYYSTGIEALQVLCMRMISDEDDILQEYRSEYEDLLFCEDLETESRMIEVFKESEFLATALLYLRWCAILGFSISWAPDKSLWVKRLSSDYPSKHHG